MSRRSEEKLAERADLLAEEEALRDLAAGGPGLVGLDGYGAEAAAKKSAKAKAKARAKADAKSEARRGGKEKGPAKPREPYVPARGWPGAGGGRVGYMDPPTMWRATTVQACGMWPFAAGSGSPMIGVPSASTCSPAPRSAATR